MSAASYKVSGLCSQVTNFWSTSAIDPASSQPLAGLELSVALQDVLGQTVSVGELLDCAVYQAA